MKIHKEGFTSIIITTIIFLASVIVIQIVSKDFHWLHGILYVSFIITWGIVVYFFRVPKRKFVFDENAIISPADGKIVVVEKVIVNEFFRNEERLQVSIFMSPLDVHMNIIPFNGIIKYFKYYPGKYLFAWAPKSSLINERTSIVLEKDSKKNALIRQIAGALARRIVCYCKKDKSFNQGEQLGFIKFGSRVDLFLPLDTKINVKIGDRVVGGISIIGYWD
ncbi:MAG: phosphatidylserine decarboxylase family protein [Bacteroidetes bacterium]|nr:phosphatidylserine decarboxylase family protein [Bacteroidota bacterium]